MYTVTVSHVMFVSINVHIAPFPGWIFYWFKSIHLWVRSTKIGKMEVT